MQDSATTEGNLETGIEGGQIVALEMLKGLCVASGLNADAVVRSSQRPYLQIELIGEDVRSTFGRNGQSLDALQFLCNTALSRKAPDVRLMLDADGYRQRRADTLKEQALEAADEVKKQNIEAEMGPLPAHERRIVHSVLSEDPDIITYSEGEEPNRRIVITVRAAQS